MVILMVKYVVALIMKYLPLQLGKVPETVSEEVDRLLLILTDEQKTEIAVLQEGNLIDLHYKYNDYLRSVFIK